MYGKCRFRERSHCEFSRIRRNPKHRNISLANADALGAGTSAAVLSVPSAAAPQRRPARGVVVVAVAAVGRIPRNAVRTSQPAQYTRSSGSVCTSFLAVPSCRSVFRALHVPRFSVYQSSRFRLLLDRPELSPIHTHHTHDTDIVGFLQMFRDDRRLRNCCGR